MSGEEIRASLKFPVVALPLPEMKMAAAENRIQKTELALEKNKPHLNLQHGWLKHQSINSANNAVASS